LRPPAPPLRQHPRIATKKSWATATPTHGTRRVLSRDPRCETTPRLPAVPTRQRRSQSLCEARKKNAASIANAPHSRTPAQGPPLPRMPFSQMKMVGAANAKAALFSSAASKRRSGMHNLHPLLLFRRSDDHTILDEGVTPEGPEVPE